MQETTYGLRVILRTDYQTAIERATAALKAEGFGVLTTIDVQQTLRAKLDREFRKYVILGACNPVLADRALHAELEIGLLLPCNVIVYEIEQKPSLRRWRRWRHSELSARTQSCKPSRAKQTYDCGAPSRLLFESRSSKRALRQPGR